MYLAQMIQIQKGQGDDSPIVLYHPKEFGDEEQFESYCISHGFRKIKRGQFRKKEQVTGYIPVYLFYTHIEIDIHGSAAYIQYDRL